MRFHTIIIANIAEAFEGIIEGIPSHQERHARISIEHGLCERALFWEGDNKVVITPFPISRSLLQRNREVFSYRNVVNLSPDHCTISLSAALLKDKKLLKEVTDIIRENPGIKISPYCVTKNFLLLVHHFQKNGLRFSVSERPVSKHPSRLVSQLDSKVGSRSVIASIRHLSVRIPESETCKTHEEVIEALSRFARKRLPCVVKANYGESGWGTIILSDTLFKNEENFIAEVRRKLKKDSIWKTGLFLVEEYIESAPEQRTTPSCELYVSGRGATITYLCDQTVGESGNFLGISLGKGVLTASVTRRLRAAASVIGERFWKAGYRGFFDIDFVISKDGTPFVIETNMRRTGGTHVYDGVKSLVGEKWMKMIFALSQDNFTYGKRILSDKGILKKMETLLYPIKGKKSGIIITIVGKTRPTFGYIIIAESQKAAQKIYNQMLSCWDGWSQ